MFDQLSHLLTGLATLDGAGATEAEQIAYVALLEKVKGASAPPPRPA